MRKTIVHIIENIFNRLKKKIRIALVAYRDFSDD